MAGMSPDSGWLQCFCKATFQQAPFAVLSRTQLCSCLHKIQLQKVSRETWEGLLRRGSPWSRPLQESPCLSWLILWYVEATVRGGFQVPVCDDGWVWSCSLGNRQESAEHRCCKAAKLIFSGNVQVGSSLEYLNSLNLLQSKSYPTGWTLA